VDDQTGSGIEFAASETKEVKPAKMFVYVILSFSPKTTAVGV
jgi:hypothetical protein